MHVVSKLQCGFRQDGSILLHKGDNHLAEPLLPTERAFIDAMVLAKLVEIVSEVPPARASETRAIKPATRLHESTETKLKSSAEIPKRAMRTRRVAK